MDSTIFFDITSGDPAENWTAARALNRASSEGSLTISTVCYAELSFRFKSQANLDLFLQNFLVAVTPLDLQTAFLAGKFHAGYKSRGGTRERILADFLIAAHAQIHADRLLTRDHRFFGGSFPALQAVHPADLQ